PSYLILRTRTPTSTLFPYTTLFRSDMVDGLELTAGALERDDDELAERAVTNLRDLRDRLSEVARLRRAGTRVARHSLVWRLQVTDRKSTRLNSSHLGISYAVFCLKK